jgi:type IV pilus assembly protein PilM
VPLPLAEVSLDWHAVGKRTDENGNESQQILLNSVAKEHIQRYQKIFSLAGLELVAIENEGTALARSFTQNEPKPVLIMDIGSRSTGFFAAQTGTLKLVGQTDFSGGSITQSIANSLNIPTTRAEEMKKRQAIGAKDQNSELSTLIETILDVIMNDVRRVKDNFEASYREKIVKIILTGGGANLVGIEEYVSRQLGLPTIKGNPFAALNFPQKLEPVIKDLGSHIAAAIGLGLRATE